LQQIKTKLVNHDGVMVGRAIYNNWEWLLHYDDIINKTYSVGNHKSIDLYSKFVTYLNENYYGPLYIKNTLHYIKAYMFKKVEVE